MLFILAGCDKDKIVPEENNDGNSNEFVLEEEILDLVNDHRLGIGKITLEFNDACNREALKHSQNMADGKVDFGHDGFDTRYNILKEEISIVGMGENVAWGQTSASQVMTAWLESSTHRENIEGDYTHLGIGIFPNKDSVLYFTQIFVKIN